MLRFTIAMGAILLTPSAHASQEILWATVSAGALSEASSFNPLGATQVINTSTGNYTILFTGATAEAGDGSNGYVHAVSRDEGVSCHVSGWGIPAASVQCRNAGGTLVNADFRLAMIPANNEKRIVFALAHQPTTGSYAPAAPYSWNAGQSINITRVNTGIYTVTFTGRDTSGGTFLASSFGNNSNLCRVQDLSNVRCTTHDGTPVDSQFTVAAVSGGEFPRAMGFGFKSGAADSFNSSYTYNSAGQSPSISKLATGVYTVQFPGLTTNANRRNMVLVTAETAARFCSANSVGGNDTDHIANIRCFDLGGAPADSTFYVQMLSQELLRNSGFELPNVAATTANITPVGWSVEGSTAGLTSVAASPASDADGRHRLRFTSNSVFIFQDVPTTPGRIYRLFLRASYVNTQSKLRLDWGDYSTLMDLTNVMEVQAIGLPATATSTRLRLSLNSGSTVDIDSAILYLQSESTTCNFSVAPNSLVFDAYGLPKAVSVNSSSLSSCVFQIGQVPDWIALPALGKRHSPATVELDPSRLTFPAVPRSGTATIAGQTVQVSQTAACDTAISMTPIPAQGGAGAIQLPNSPCTYSLTLPQGSFLSFTGVSSGVGGTSIPVSATPNPSASPRNVTVGVTLILDGFQPQPLSVNLTAQLGAGCSFTLSNNPYNAPASGATAIVDVTASSGSCAWSVQNPSNFVTVNGGSGTGSGSFQIAVAPNTGQQSRTATLTIGNATLIVNQAGASNCNVTFSPSSVNAGASQTRTFVTVTNNTGSACVWSVENIPSFVRFETPYTNLAGSGSLGFVVEANSSPGSRTATMQVAGTPLTIHQAGASGCVFALSHPFLFVPDAGGADIRVNVHNLAGTNCSWDATGAAFVSIAGRSTGPGPGWVSLNIGPKQSTSIYRTTSINVAGIDLGVYQYSAACTYTVSPLSTQASANGSTGLEINVTQTGGLNTCGWSVTNIPPHVTVTSPASLYSSGKVQFNVAANNTGSTRIDTMFVAGQAVQLTQPSTVQPCVYAVSPLTHNVASGGATGLTVNVATTTGCSWTVTNPSPFVTVNSGSGGGTGNGTVTFSVPANTSTTARSAQLTIAGQTVTVNQAGATTGNCAFTLSQPNISVPATGGNGFSVQVNNTAGSSCNWSVLNSSSFVVVTAGAQGGTGSGTVAFNVLANTAASGRTATLTIAGLFLTVTQAGITPPAPNTSGLRFVPLEPCRVLETRQEYNYQGRTGSFGPPFFNAAETRTMNLPQSTVCNVPAAAKAYVLNVTVIPRGSGVDYLTVWPAGEARPEYWTVRSPDAQIVANSAIVAAGANGGISVFASQATDMIIDIAGYFTDNAALSNLVFYPLTPCRVVDTRALYRQAGTPFGPPALAARETRSYRFPATPFCNIPEGASAYSITITVDPNSQPLQFITTWPSGQGMPNVSSINSPSGRILANSVIVPASANGSIDVHAFNQSDLILDINGYFAPDDGVNGLYFFTAPQCRISDSSNATFNGAYGPPIYENESTRSIVLPGQTRCSGLPSNARAFALNTTVLPGGSPMPFLTIYPTGQSRPNASVINAFQGQIVTSAAIVPAGPNGSIDVFAYRRTHVVVEVSGYFGR
ncbi:MAG: BACON domain-containing protein [Bryobacterales bacterium]|nr:BACON domain-containing protein [Bryobacterales bacterium]